jgi:hypothetical protein
MHLKTLLQATLIESETVKFWIDSNMGTVERFDGEDHHENELPGDGSLGFNGAMQAGWVRGGITPGRTARMYLSGKDQKTVRLALARIQKDYATHVYALEWHSPSVEFHSLGPKQARVFVRTGWLPTGNVIEEREAGLTVRGNL